MNSAFLYELCNCVLEFLLNVGYLIPVAVLMILMEIAGKIGGSIGTGIL